jgi:hypothetical protein
MAALIVAFARHAGVPEACHAVPRTATLSMRYEATEAVAQEQREAYFALMPSKALPTVSLDLRAWADSTNDAVEAGVFARQEGTVPKFKNIGTVSAASETDLTPAVAAQRTLIERWAYELLNDFETNELKIDPGAPIELAWAIQPERPSLLDSLMGKKAAEAVMTTVASDAACEPEELRCGFLGVLAREYRGGGVSARYDRIEIGKPPEVPFRAPSQAKYDKKYLKKGKLAGTVGTKEDGRIIV